MSEKMQALADALNRLYDTTSYTTQAIETFATAWIEAAPRYRTSSPLLARHRQRRHK